MSIFFLKNSNVPSQLLFPLRTSIWKNFENSHFVDKKFRPRTKKFFEFKFFSTHSRLEIEKFFKTSSLFTFQKFKKKIFRIFFRVHIQKFFLISIFKSVKSFLFFVFVGKKNLRITLILVFHITVWKIQQCWYGASQDKKVYLSLGEFFCQELWEKKVVDGKKKLLVVWNYEAIFFFVSYITIFAHSSKVPMYSQQICRDKTSRKTVKMTST